MKRNLNSDLITEKEFNDIKFNNYKSKFEDDQNLESFLKSLPYSDDFPRYYFN